MYNPTKVTKVSMPTLVIAVSDTEFSHKLYVKVGNMFRLTPINIIECFKN